MVPHLRELRLVPAKDGWKFLSAIWNDENAVDCDSDGLQRPQSTKLTRHCVYEPQQVVLST